MKLLSILVSVRLAAISQGAKRWAIASILGTLALST